VGPIAVSDVAFVFYMVSSVPGVSTGDRPVHHPGTAKECWSARATACSVRIHPLSKFPVPAWTWHEAVPSASHNLETNARYLAQPLWVLNSNERGLTWLSSARR
jgi:hypothetical protein